MNKFLAVILLLFAAAAQAAVPTTTGLKTGSFEQVIMGPEVIAGVSFNSPPTLKIQHRDGSTMFVMNGSGELRFPHTMLGPQGSHMVPSGLLGIGLVLSTNGRPVMNFRYLGGLHGSATSFDSLTFTEVNNDQWTGYVSLPDALSDPFGFSIRLACQGNPCSARVTPFFAVAAPVPEPSTSLMMLLGALAIAGRLRVAAKHNRRQMLKM